MEDAQYLLFLVDKNLIHYDLRRHNDTLTLQRNSGVSEDIQDLLPGKHVPLDLWFKLNSCHILNLVRIGPKKIINRN